MTKYALILLTLLSAFIGYNQCMTTGGFEAPEWTTHSSGNWTQSTSEGTWTATSSYVNGGSNNSGANKFGMNATGDELITPAYTDPCDLSFYVRTSSDPDDWVMDVQTSTSAAGPWTTATTVTENGVGGTITDAYTQITVPLNLIGTYYIRFVVVSRSAGSVFLDDISLTCACSTNTISTGAVSAPPFIIDCSGPTSASGTVSFTSTGTFTAGNVYTAQLSNGSGSFSAPIDIGTLASTANSGVINITIPATLPSGVAYQIQIISDNPAVTGTASAPFTITQSSACGPALPASEGLIINEWSNGPSGNQEYYEFVVAGQCGTSVDIRGYILDDNNGTFTDPSAYSGTASGIAPGHFRFSYVAQWASIPVGSLIVIYNADDPNPSLPADDPTDADNDSLYVVPHTNALFERCTAYPQATSPDSVYTPCTYTSGGGWNPLSLRNGGDAIQVRHPDGSYYHGVSYGGAEMTGGPHNLKLFTGDGTAMCGWFTDGDFFDVINWSSGGVAGNETPGVPNNALNATWLNLMRNPVGTNCPITVLPVELMYFEGENTEATNILHWATASEHNAAYFILDRSTDGVNWTKVDQVPAAGNSNSAEFYNYYDSRFTETLNYYRLSQTDVDGTTTVYNEYVVIDNRAQEPVTLVKIVNLLGQTINENTAGVQIHVYSDGSSVKKFK